jgi:transposase
MDRLYYLTEEQFTPINRLLPPEQGGRGRPPKIRHREALEGILHILRTGTPWRDLPQRVRGMAYRVQALAAVGGAGRVVADPAGAEAPEADCWGHCLSRCHCRACAPACRRRPQKKGDHALGRSCGGLRTKIHALCGSESDAIDLRITAGQAGDAPVGDERIDALDTPEGIRQAAMDKAYDSNAIRTKLTAQGIAPVILPNANRLESMVYDKAQYKQRNKVERLFNTLKQFRRVATRYDKRKAMFLAFVILALIVIMLR